MIPRPKKLVWSQQGFTLIEVLITGVISSIVAGAIITVLYMTNDQIKEGIATEKLIQISTAATEQIRRSARMAAIVTCSTAVLNRDLNFFDSDGNQISGYKINSGGVLQEWVVGVGWKTMVIGSDSAIVVGSDSVTLVSSDSALVVLPDGHGIKMKLRYIHSESGINVDFPPIEDQALCRGDL